jgi:ubiquinone biosynthesis protein UbiJ
VFAVSSGPLGETIFETAINAYVSLDPELQEGLAEIAGKRVEISIRGTGIIFQLCFETERLRFLAHAEHPADIMLEATPFALLRLVAAMGEGPVLSGRELVIKGEVADAQRIRSLLSRRHLDAEELLSRFLGDVPARQLGNLVRSLADAGRRTTRSLLQDLGEYLTEESRTTAGRAELDALAFGVESLRDDVERLHKRLLRLEQRSRPEQRV